MKVLLFGAAPDRVRSRVLMEGTGEDDRAFARTRAQAARVSDLLADRSRAARAGGCGAEADAAMRLAERLRHLRPEDGHLRALVAWFAAASEDPAAPAGEAARPGD
jgi:hypothetical protein